MKFRNIWHGQVNVNAKSREPNEVFEEEETRELKNLVQAGYLEKVKNEKSDT